MAQYKVNCIYTKARFCGKMAVPANDNWRAYQETITCSSERGIFPTVLKDIQNKTAYRYVKINDLHYTPV